MDVGLIVVLVVVGVLLLWGVLTYNGLVRRRNEVDNAWSQIDVQLKRRLDLIPNLVDTVKGYANFERSALEAVIAARSKVIAAPDTPAAKGEADLGLSGALRQLFALSEAYPDLKANTNFMQLQGELTSTENIISGARNGYNNAAGGYNQTLVQFPTNLVAGLFGFKAMPFFEVTDAAERNAPQV